MGIIARQSFKAATVTYVGILMGVINQIIIYPLTLSIEQYGELQFVIQTSAFFTPFLLLGTTTLFTKYYPVYAKTEDKKQSLYGLIFFIVTLNVLIFLGLFLIFKEQVIEHYNDNSAVSEIAVMVLFGIGAIVPYITIARSVSAVHGRISIPSLLGQLFKFALPLLAAGYYFNYFPFEKLLIFLFVYFLLLAVAFVLYMMSREKIRPNFSVRDFKSNLALKPMMIFAFFSLLTGIGGTLTNQIDVVMITSLKGTYQNGLYSWSLFIANAVAIPFSLIVAISMPMIAKFWAERDNEKINEIYLRTASSLLVFSLGVFLALWLVLDDVFLLMPKGDEYQMAKYMVLMLCVANIIDMASGVNSQIIAMSKDYKLLLWMLLLAAVVNVGLNFLLIPQYGIEGSGVATIISIVVFNLTKFIFLKKKYGFNPFSKTTLYILGLALTVYFAVSFLPRTSLPLANLFLYSGLYVMIFGLLSYKLKLAPELNGFINKQFRRINIKPFD